MDKVGFQITPRHLPFHVLPLIAMIIALLFITGFELKLLHTEMLIKHIEQNGINYDAFREMQLNEDNYKEANKKSLQVIKKNPQLQDVSYIDGFGYLTFSMMASSFNLLESNLVDETTFLRGIGRIAQTSGFQELYEYYKAILFDLEYFPVPILASETADITYDNSWNVLRRYGGNRRHEGADLMASNNLRGFFPIISITDGTVEKMGWLEQGGYRIGIRSKEGGYFYYAHLDSYAPGLTKGDSVIAGQLLGFMGDSGYGSEGTVGQFDVHLHLGIYVETDTGEMSVNPYWILKLLEDNRTHYVRN
jgi:murein DD-endopeptidase MepM/ murein hydrolase activator NlpD